MIQSICIHGRQPTIARAELESLFGSEALTLIGDSATGLDIPADKIDFQRLGGSPKLARLLTTIPSTKWSDIEEYLAKTIPEHLKYVPDGKFRLGLSVYGLQVNINKLKASALSLKKVIKSTGRSVRIIPNPELALNTAQVLHNKLTDPTGWELLLIRDGEQTLLAQTFAIQDIEAYGARDQARPKRDARVGMLPPKLAQIIVNLASGDRQITGRLLDPFCGTGVVLQEAALMGFAVYGTDLDERMVDYAQQNLDWLIDTHRVKVDYSVDVADACDFIWQQPVDFIACETYLGRPFSVLPAPDVLDEVIRDVDTITRKFLQNVASQTPEGFRMCIAVPAWKTNNGFKHLPTLDSLEKIGYNFVEFKHVGNRDLIYHRENQIVGRELVALIRK